MKELRICLVRHGKTAANEVGKYCGRGDFPLSAIGIIEIENLVKEYAYPKIEKLYTSPLRRCTETARLCFGSELPLNMKEDLMELDFGDFENEFAYKAKKLKNFDDFLKGNLDFSFPNGETCKNLQDRMSRVFTEIVEDSFMNDITSIGVVTHSIAMFFLIQKHLSCFNNIFSKKDMFIPNGYGISILIEEGKWENDRKFDVISLEPKNSVRPDITKSPYY